jgi:hypothetical protein
MCSYYIGLVYYKSCGFCLFACFLLIYKHTFYLLELRAVPHTLRSLLSLSSPCISLSTFLSPPMSLFLASIPRPFVPLSVHLTSRKYQHASSRHRNHVNRCKIAHLTTPPTLHPHPPTLPSHHTHPTLIVVGSPWSLHSLPPPVAV